MDKIIFLIVIFIILRNLLKPILSGQAGGKKRRPPASAPSHRQSQPLEIESDEKGEAFPIPVLLDPDWLTKIKPFPLPAQEPSDHKPPPDMYHPEPHQMIIPPPVKERERVVFHNLADVRQAIIMSEILRPPLAMRGSGLEL
jgi:hypothetical protein